MAEIGRNPPPDSPIPRLAPRLAESYEGPELGTFNNSDVTIPRGWFTKSGLGLLRPFEVFGDGRVTFIETGVMKVTQEFVALKFTPINVHLENKPLHPWNLSGITAATGLTVNGDASDADNFVGVSLCGVDPELRIDTVRFTAKRVGMDGHVGTAQHSYADDETMQPWGTFEVRNTGQIDTPILNVESDVALNGGCAAATHYPPEQGGDFLIGYTFPDDVMTPETQRERIAGEKRSVKVEGLESLGLVGTPWFTLIGETPFHAFNHYGTPTLNAAIHIMAQYYYDKPATAGRQIQINDMSLEYGGMFDICGTWNRRDSCSNPDYPAGHQEHRVGLNADIKRLTSDGNAVNEAVLDEGIGEAITQMGLTGAACNWHPPVPNPARHCHLTVMP